MKTGDEASLSIILAGRALLVKILITLEMCGAFCSNFEYLCVFTLSSNWYAIPRQGFIEHYFGRLSSFSENVHTS